MSNKPSILLVEDEESIARGLSDLFVYHGFDVETVGDGLQALEMIKRGKYSLVVLDVMLPSMDGFSVCENIRQFDRELPVIMLTAKAQEQDIITGFSLGADDYVTKPFSVSELVMRVKAVLRRTGRDRAKVKAIGVGKRISIDVASLSGTVAGTQEKIEFTRREVDLLVYLQNHGQAPVTRGDLLSEVWGYERAAQIETRTVDIHIAKLRRKIEPDYKAPVHLLTTRGEGYSLAGCELIYE